MDRFFFLIFPCIGLPSPSGRSQKHGEDDDLQRSQTFGQRIMGNMRDSLFVRSFTAKPKSRTSDVLSYSPSKVTLLSIHLRMCIL